MTWIDTAIRTHALLYGTIFQAFTPLTILQTLVHYYNYGGMISTCSEVRSSQTLTEITKKERNTSNYAITSNAMYFCFACDKDCDSRILNKTVYLGQKFSIFVACFSQSVM